MVQICNAFHNLEFRQQQQQQGLILPNEQRATNQKSTKHDLVIVELMQKLTFKPGREKVIT